MEEAKSSYGKKPLWQWIVIYVVVGVIVYGVIYYFFMHKQNSYTYQPNSSQQAQQPTQTQNSVYKMMPKDKLGTVMTDMKGMTLYTFAKDTSGVSTCSDKCLQLWPPYAAKSQSESLPANISVIKRSDGSWQYAWKGMPLYYYTKDGDAGDAYGNGIGGVWSVVK